MTPNFIAVVVDFDACTVALASDGALWRQERAGLNHKWLAVGLTGLTAAVQGIAVKPDGSLVAVTSDGRLWEHRAIGGTRYDQHREWAELPLPDEEAA
jgi:photosystem II stability/assembly factor-like uncharacterized protein